MPHSKRIIAISPDSRWSDESAIINQLFEAGLYRFHLNKSEATEQSLAEILDKVSTKHLSQITLHSHFHLVLAFGVGGIHFSEEHRLSLKEDYEEKIKLYNGFGVKVSTEITSLDHKWKPANYAILSKPKFTTILDVLELTETNYVNHSNSLSAYQIHSEESLNQCLKELY